MRNHPTRPLKLTITAAAGKTYVPLLRKHLPIAHKLLGNRSALRELSLALVGDRMMSELHEPFMGIPGPTDVLTFPLEMSSPRSARAATGEVVIDVTEAQRRATIEGIAPRLEVLLYAIHGMLHLCGYDDRTDRAYRAMHQMEDRILTQLGFGNVFFHASRGRKSAERPKSRRTATSRLQRGSR